MLFNVVIILQIERYFGLMDLLLSSNCPVLLTGPSGVGKSALIQVNNKLTIITLFITSLFQRIQSANYFYCKVSGKKILKL